MPTVTLEELVRLDKEAQRRFAIPRSKRRIGYRGSFSELGLDVGTNPTQPGSYWCSPTNSLCFGCTGGGGVHFSFLTTNEPVLESRPVIITTPAMDGVNHIIGENLYDFLCAGCRIGYDGLRHVGSRSFWDPDDSYSSIYARLDEAIREDASRPGNEEWLEFAECQGRLLDFLTKELGLVFWPEPRKHFDELQARFAGLIELPPKGR